MTFCPRYFSTRSAYTQHKNHCIPSTNNNNDSEELEEFKLKSNDHDIEFLFLRFSSLVNITYSIYV
jgi:hypothetical protein